MKIASPPESIVIKGRTYKVELKKDALDPDLPGYKLIGKRGAVYYTMRNANNRHRLFLVNARGRLFAPDTWLRDDDGPLRVH